MADQDRYPRPEPGRDRLGQRDVYMDNRTGVGANQKGYRAEWGGGRDRDRDQNYNMRRGENASFGEKDYGQPDGGRADYRGRGDERPYGTGGAGGYSGESGAYGEGGRWSRNEPYEGRYSGETGKREAGRERTSNPARSNPDFYADNNGSAGAGWTEEWGSNRDRGAAGRTYDADATFHDRDREFGREYRGGDNQRPGFWDRAADKVAAWFGGDENPGNGYETRDTNRGKGPKGYRRSDERIREDISDKLTDDHWLDASEIELRVENGDVHLTGTVKNRDDKRRAEQLAEQVSGVDNVLNHLRVEKPQDWRTETSRGATTMPAGAGATSNLGDLGTPNTAGSTPAADGNMRTGKTQ